MKFSPMWPIWAEDFAVPLAKAREAWQSHINWLDAIKLLEKAKSFRHANEPRCIKYD